MKKQKITIKKEIRLFRKEWKNILFNMIFAILTVIITSLFYKNIILTTCLLTIVSIIGLIKWRSKITILIFFVGFIFGPLAENFAINFGVWHYTLPNVLNVPLWLFILWGDAAAFLYETAKEIKRLGLGDK